MNIRGGHRAAWPWIARHLSIYVTHQAMSRDEYQLVEGYYSDTLSDQAIANSNYPDDISMAYVDCDLYDSTIHVLRFLERRLKHGMIIAFDDYFCWWATGIAGERKAFHEMTRHTPQFHYLPYVQFGWHGQSFVVEDAALLD